MIEYDPQHIPGLPCLAGRIIAETDPRLSAAGRATLWRQYGLAPTFEWIVPESAFTYHELAVRRFGLLDRLRAWLTRQALPPRALPELVAALNDDPRLHWAAPDALILDWAEEASPGAAPADGQPGGDLVALGASQPLGVTLLDDQWRTFTGTLEDWAAHADWPPPMPDFEYYRLCDPQGTAVPWAAELAGNAAFMQRCAKVYGTGQARALAAYRAAGSPELSPVTVCVADTGVLLSHPDLAGRLCPNAIDADYSSYTVATPDLRPAAEAELGNRDVPLATGFPRPAIRGQPAYHGTAVAGLVARCTAGFETTAGPIRILPASVKSARPFAFKDGRIKSPISAFIKLVACLYERFPTDPASRPAVPGIINDGTVRVVTTSASVPRRYFSDAQWHVVSRLVNKGAGAILEDLRLNDRVYLFAAGNEARGEANRPGDLEQVVAVSAVMPFDPTQPWSIPVTKEGSNLAAKCVSAPGHGIISSTLYACPNLKYLPQSEIPQPHDVLTIPKRTGQWMMQTGHFSATSSATPQVAALAALLIAQDHVRDYRAVIKLIQDSTGERRATGAWGEAHGLIDYAAALGW